MSFKGWNFWIIAIAIFVALCLSSPKLVVQAQALATNTPEIQTSESPTVEPPPTEAPVVENTPTDILQAANTLPPEPEITVTPEIASTETFAVVPTIEPSTTITPAITPTEITTPTPTATQYEENWLIEYDLFYPSAVISALGGKGAAEAELRGFLSALENEPGVSYTLGISVEDDGILFKLEIDGDRGLEQFKRIYLGILAPRFGTTGGITQIWINSSGSAISEWQLILDSNITTGFSWRTVQSTGISETNSGYQDSASNTIGATGRQVFSFRNNESENYSLSLKYSSSWEENVPPTRRIFLNIPFEAEIDLSSFEIDSLTALSVSAMSEPPPFQSPPDMGNLGAVPASFDWRDSGMVPPIREQGSCGSCYAFATVGVMESAMLINGISADLSEQFLVSCTQNYNNGCSGGFPDSHKYHVSTLAQNQSETGAVLDSDMPYTGSESACYAVAHPYRLMSWQRVDANWNTIPNTETLKNIIFSKGPVAASVCSKTAFDNYDGGIFTTNETCSGSATNHAIILTGWKEDPVYGTVWILRNSWGTWWGDQGYMYIKAGTSSVGYNATYVVYEPLEDRIAPMVSKLDSISHTADNRIVINEDISVSVSQLLVTYDEVMYYSNGIDDVASLPNYSLVDLGADNLDGGGDDIPIVIDSASYNTTNRTLTLNINNNNALQNATYRFKVSGSGSVKDFAGSLLDGDGDGLPGGDYVISFKIAAKPPAPALLEPISGFVTNDNTPDLRWATAKHAASYEIVIARDSAFTSPIFRKNVGSVLSLTTPVMADGKYYWRVRGVNRFNDAGAWSSSRNLTVDTIAPVKPVLISPADQGSSRGTPLFTWKAASGAKYYIFKTTTETGDLVYSSTEITALSHKPSEQPLGILLWQVRARDAAGNLSEWSNARTLLVKPKIPAAPTLLLPLNNMFTMNQKPSLDWSDVPYGTQYQLQVAFTDTFKTDMIWRDETTASSLSTEVNLQKDSKYYWRVRAINAENEPGQWSSTRNFTVDNVAPKIPILDTPEDNKVNKGTPTYYWTSVSGGAFYQFRYSTTVEQVLYTSPEVDITSHKPPTQPVGKYLWQVRARDKAGNWSNWSESRTIVIQAPIPAAPKLTAPANQAEIKDTTPLLDWSTANYATGYEIQISKNSGFSGIIQQQVVNGVTEYIAKPLTYSGTGTNYYWRVRSINTYGQTGSWSAFRSFKIIS